MRARIRRIANVVAAAAVAGALLTVAGKGWGPLPALGQLLAPGTGVWAVAAAVPTAHREQLRLPGLRQPVTVSFTSAGIASITAATDHDLYLAQGYVTAYYRLTQMDLERRLGEGRISQLGGISGLASDEFELKARPLAHRQGGLVSDTA
ncbi:MAG TPA: penicillin acylase family protein [Streptosporangiaceae bacterium]|nr:penicillin acylase family protein [Streptosporangiaceae bacterium]